MRSKLLRPSLLTFSIWVSLMDLLSVTAVIIVSPWYVNAITKEEDYWYFNDDTSFLYRWLVVLGLI